MYMAHCPHSFSEIVEEKERQEDRKKRVIVENGGCYETNDILSAHTVAGI